jgi:hypothetical protein
MYQNLSIRISNVSIGYCTGEASPKRYEKRYGSHCFVLFHHVASLITGEGASVRWDWASSESRVVSRRW